MKKTVLFLILAAGLLSCSKEPVQQEITSAGEPLKFEINVADFKAAKTAWAEGDVIYVFFQSFSNKYLTLTREADGTWTNTFVGELTAADLTGGLGGDYLTAVYFPVEVKVEYANLEYCFTDKETGGAVYSYYLFDKDREYEVDGSTVRATLQMEKPADVVLFHVAGIQESIDNYTFGCSLVRPMACASVGTDGSITESLLQPGARLSGFADADGAVFGGRLTTAGSADYTFTLASNDKIYTLKRTGKTLEPGKMYEFPPLDDPEWTVEDNPGFINGYAYVEMGDGLKWATCNIGAENPWDYGDYYAWGETATKESYAWTNYIFAKDPSDYSNGVKKYSEEDSNKTLFPEDDAATSLWKDPWRMPTVEEWAVLRDVKLYTWKWETNYNGSGKNGMLVTRKEGTGPCAGNSIFLPAAGRWFESQWLSGGSHGFYWSSSLDTALFAMGVEVLDSGFRSLTADRYAGLNVRPVTD